MPARAPRSPGPVLALGVLGALGALGTGLACAPVAAASTHTVVVGDTLYGLAAAHHTTASALARANSLADARRIRPGQQLTIPDPAAPAPAPAPAPAAPPAGPPAPPTAPPPAPPTVTYTVVAGDTLYALAAAHHTTPAALAQLNALTDPRRLAPGRQIVVPGTAPAAPPVASTFAGRTYPPGVTASATAHRDALLARPVPTRAAMRRIVHDSAQGMGVDPSLALAVAHQESGFDMRAVSPADAIGAMQVVPATGRTASALVGRPLDLLDPQDNATAGVALLRQLTGSAPDEDTAIAGYYQGLAGVLAHGMLPDTAAYVASVKAQRDAFR